MFAFLKRRKEDKLMQEAMVIIGKALILNKVPSDDAHKISLVSMDILHKTIGEIDSHPWVLAVRGMYLFMEELIKDSDDDIQELINVLGSTIRLSEQNANENATELEKLILNSIYKNL
jgi:hypothetical protein